MTLQRMPSKNKVKEPYNMRSWDKHCGFTLKNVNYDERSITLETVDGSEEVKFSFEYIQDLAKYTTGEWDWRIAHPVE